MDNNIVAFIPARSGSKSIPDKNIKELGGKPLIAYSIETGIESGLRTIFNTDSEEYAKIGKKYGAEIMIRPEDLAKDSTSMFEVLESEVLKLDPVPEYVLLLQPTTPFRSINKVKLAISLILKNKEFTSLVVAERVPDKYAPEQMIINTPSGLTMANGVPIPQRVVVRQQHKEAWIPCGSYIFKTSNFKEGNLYGDKTMILETEPTININTPDDWKEAIKYLEKND